MNLGDHKELRRRLEALAQQQGLEMMPDGFRLIIPPDEDDDTLVVHAVFLARSEAVEAMLAQDGAAEGADQSAIDDAFMAIIEGDQKHEQRETVRREAEEKANKVKEELIEELKKNGGFL